MFEGVYVTSETRTRSTCTVKDSYKTIIGCPIKIMPTYHNVCCVLERSLQLKRLHRLSDKCLHFTCTFNIANLHNYYNCVVTNKSSHFHLRNNLCFACYMLQDGGLLFANLRINGVCSSILSIYANDIFQKADEFITKCVLFRKIGQINECLILISCPESCQKCPNVIAYIKKMKGIKEKMF